jgi:hypothetical protein
MEGSMQTSLVKDVNPNTYQLKILTRIYRLWENKDNQT